MAPTLRRGADACYVHSQDFSWIRSLINCSHIGYQYVI